MSDISAGRNLNVACLLLLIFFFLLRRIINYFCKILSQYTIYIHQAPVFVRVSYSLFPSNGARETSSYLCAHNISNQMQYLDYIPFDVHISSNVCLCGLVWSIADIQKILLLLKWQTSTDTSFTVYIYIHTHTHYTTQDQHSKIICCGEQIHVYMPPSDNSVTVSSSSSSSSSSSNSNKMVHERGPSQCMKREMSQCCGIKQYTQTEKLQQIGQI